MDRRSDSWLVAACLRGDEAAWTSLIERYAPLIWGLLRRLGVPAPDNEDLFQNVCLKLYAHLGSLKDIERLAGWLSAITRQEVAAWGRRRRTLSEIPETLPDTAPSPEALALEEERHFQVRAALARIPEPCRTLLTRLYSPDPPSYADLARELNVPLGSLGPRRARCLERLRKLCVLD